MTTPHTTPHDNALLNLISNAVGGEEFVPLSTRYALAERVLRALAADGWELVKLPEADVSGDGFTDWECPPYRRISTINTGGHCEVFPAYRGEPEEPLSPTEARELAGKYLAAAKHAEGQHE